MLVSNDMQSVGRLLYPTRGRVLVLPLAEGMRDLLLPQGKEVASMRRFLLVLSVAALMAAMMVSAGPAQANETSFGNSNNFVQVGNSLFGVGDIDDFDDNGIDFGHNFGHNGIIFGGIDQDSHSGDIRIG